MPGIQTGDLRIGGFEGIHRVLDFTMEELPGQHSSASIRAVLARTAGRWAYEGPVHNRAVTVRADGEKYPVYTGIIQEIHASEENGIHQVRLELSSGTVLMDLVKKDHSYQDTGMSYGALFGQISGQAGAGAVWPPSLDGVPIGVPRIQYQETDWEFMKRLASHGGLPLYPEPEQGGTRVCIGLPEAGEPTELDWTEYTSVLDGRYYELGGEGTGYLRDQLRSYELESMENHRVGERTLFNGQEVTICTKTCETMKGRLVFRYRLAYPEWAGQRWISNEKLSGLSLLGTVLSRAGETVCLKLDIDEGHPDQNEGNAYPFPWTPATGNLMYLMPTVGSRVSLYFKGGEESSALAVNCIRREGEGGRSSYRERSLVTEHGKEMKLHPCSMGFISVSHKVLIDDYEGISLTGSKSLQIAASGMVKIEGENISLSTDKGTVSCYHGVGEMSDKETVSFVKDSEFHLQENGRRIVSLGSNSTRIAGSKHETFGVDCRFRHDPEEDSYDTAGLVVRVITGGLVVCGVTIAPGGIATVAGAGASTVSAVMSAAAITGGMTVTGMAVTDYVSGHLSSYESYMKTALAGSIVGAMTGAAALVPVSGGWAHAAIDFSTGMMGDGVMQQAMTGEVNGEQMFASGVFSVFVGAFARKVGRLGEGGSGPDNIYDLYRKASNTGEFQDLEELMQLKNVKNVADKAGIGLDGVKIKIDRNVELLGKGLYGYTDGKTITLYPDAFTDIETLVKTLGHERMHVYQVEVFGKPLSTDVLKEFEKAAFGSEKSWWEYFECLNGGKK